MIVPGAGSWAGLALLGGVVALDGTSLGQVMLSRPLVAATLAGLAVGDPASGAMVGVVLEALQLGVLPVGASRYPESGPPAVAAGALFALSDGSGAALALAVLFALVWEWVCGLSVQRLRQFNVRFAVPAGTTETELERLERRHLTAVGVDFVRGAVLTALGVGLLSAATALLPHLALPGAAGRLVVGGIAAAAFAAALRSFGERLWWFVGGAAGGALLLVLR